MKKILLAIATTLVFTGCGSYPQKPDTVNTMPVNQPDVDIDSDYYLIISYCSTTMPGYRVFLRNAGYGGGGIAVVKDSQGCS